MLLMLLMLLLLRLLLLLEMSSRHRPLCMLLGLWNRLLQRLLDHTGPLHFLLLLHLLQFHLQELQRLGI